MSKSKTARAAARRAEVLNVIEKQGWKNSPALSAICEKYGWKKDFSFFNNNIRADTYLCKKKVCAKVYFCRDILPIACDVVFIKEVPFEDLPAEEQVRVARMMTLSPETDIEKDEKQGFGFERIRRGLLSTRLAEYIEDDTLAAEIANGGNCNFHMRLKKGDTIACLISIVSEKTGKDISFDDIAERLINEIAGMVIDALSENQKGQDSFIQGAVRAEISRSRPNAKNIRFDGINNEIYVSYEAADDKKPGIINTYSKSIGEGTVRNIVKKGPGFDEEIAKTIALDDGWKVSKVDVEKEFKEEIKRKIFEAISCDIQAANDASPLVVEMLKAGLPNGGRQRVCAKYLRLIMHGDLPENDFSNRFDNSSKVSLSKDGFKISYLEITASYSYKTNDIFINRSESAEGIVSLLSKSKSIFSNIESTLKDNIKLFFADATPEGLDIASPDKNYVEGITEGITGTLKGEDLPGHITLKYDLSNASDVEKWLREKIKQHEEALKKKNEKIKSLGKENALYPEIVKILSNCPSGASISKITSVLRSPKTDTSFMTDRYIPGRFKSFSKDDIEDAVRGLVSFGILLETETYWRKIRGYYTSYEIKNKNLASLFRQNISSDEEKDVSTWKANDWEYELLYYPGKLKEMKTEDLKMLFNFPAVCEKCAGVISENICGREDGKAITDFVELAAKFAPDDKKTSFAALRKAVRKENKKIAAKV